MTDQRFFQHANEVKRLLYSNDLARWEMVAILEVVKLDIASDEPLPRDKPVENS